MAALNITYNGLSADYPLELDTQVTDKDLRRIAVEVIRAGGVPGLHLQHLGDDAFDGFVVDRLQGGQRVPTGPEAVLALWEEEGLRIVPLVAESAAIRHLMRRYASVPMSFADACLVRLMELEPGTTLATCDSDFRIYRRFSRQTVPLVTPAD